jgi:5'-AMP-activated protein kinase, regulatory gamma subunit
MPAAPLWDPALCQFVGILTVTDFINLLCHAYHDTQTSITTIASRSIAEVLNDPKMPKPAPFLAADTTTTLQQASRLLHQNGMDFLPIVFPEDMRVLATITYTTLLEHLVTHFREQRRLFDDNLMDLHIGTYHDEVITVQPQDTLAHALKLMDEHNLSALPVVVTLDDNNPDQEDEYNQTTSSRLTSTSSLSHVPPKDRYLVGVYSRSDITFLATAQDASDAVDRLRWTVGEILAQQANGAIPTDVATSTSSSTSTMTATTTTTPDALHVCRTDSTLQSAFEYFAHCKFHRLYLVDPTKEGQPILRGVVSARDLVAYFLEDE